MLENYNFTDTIIIPVYIILFGWHYTRCKTKVNIMIERESVCKILYFTKGKMGFQPIKKKKKSTQ